jgi:hypothetical protein
MSRAMIDAGNPHAWLGHLAGTIGCFLQGSLKERDLRESYVAYRESPCVDDELRDLLPEPPKKGKP